jgi:chromate transporter
MIVYAAAHFWNRWRESAWHAAIAEGFVPVGAGLVLAGALAVLQSRGVLEWGIALIVAGCRMWRPNVHPFTLLGFGAVFFVLSRSIL